MNIFELVTLVLIAACGYFTGKWGGARFGTPGWIIGFIIGLVAAIGLYIGLCKLIGGPTELPKGESDPK